MTRKKQKIIIIVGVVVLTTILILSVWYNSINIAYIYKSNWGIEIINPRKSETIINTKGIDPTIFRKLYYTKEDIEIIKSNSYFSKMDKNLVKIKLEEFIKFLDEGMQKRFTDNFDESFLLQDSNLYAYIVDIKGGQDNTLLILDVNDNILYELTLYF